MYTCSDAMDDIINVAQHELCCGCGDKSVCWNGDEVDMEQMAKCVCRAIYDAALLG